MSSTIKLKKSSIAGRVPSASDLEYGEIAINIADGKLYFKNSSNAIQSFEAGDLGVDSATVLSLIDSSHIQARQIDEGLDSAEVNTLIASGLQNAFSRILVDGQFDVVSDSTQDGLTLDAGHNITITTVPNDDTITFTTSAIGADSVTSLIDSSYVDLRLPSRMVTLTDSQELSNKTLTGPVLNSPVFGTGTNSPTFTEIRFNNSNIMKFNQMYTGASSGSYFSNGEYQKVATITPDGNSQNYQVVGRITAQNAGETHTVYFNAALRSNTLPDLNWSITYNEEYTGNRYIDPQLWTKETTTAGFIFAFKTLATIYGTVTVDFEVIPRTNAQLANVTVNSTQNSEQSSVDTGFTARDMTRTHAIIGNNVRLGAYTFPTADGNPNQVLGTNGSGTLQFVNQTSGMDSASTIALVDSAYVQARQSTASDFDSSSAIGLIDSAYVQARQVDLQRDSAFVTGLIDSDYVFSRVSETSFTYQLGTDADSNNASGLNYLSTSSFGHGVAIQPDGSQLFVGNSRTVRVWDTPSTTWDVSTYNRQSSYDKDFTTHIGSSNITDFGFNDDGTRMYIINAGAVIRQFDLSTAYRPSTASYTSTDYYNPTDVGNLLGFGFSDDGTKLILSSNNISSTLGSGADGVRSYTLSTPWDITTATYDNKEIITGYRGDDYERTPISSYFANNGKDFFIFGQQARRVNHFPLATAYDITSYTTRNQLDMMHQSGSYGNAVEIVFDQNLYIGVGNNNLGSVGFSSNGTKVGFNDLVRNLIDSDYVVARAPAAGLDSAATTALIDSAYVQARQSTTDLTNYRTVTQIQSMIDSDVNALVDAAPGTLDTLNELAAALGDDANFSTTITNSIAAKVDSAQVVGIIDSSYVQARQTAQDFAYSSLTGVPSTFAPSGVDSAATFAIIDSAYVQARQVDLQRDSAFVTNIVDAAYVQARQVDLQRDSAFITGLIDSSYIQARDNVGGTTVNTLNRSVFTYTTTANQTVFTGADSDGNTLAFNNEVDVYLNGILLKQSDYVLSGGDTVTLDLATSADNILTIVDYGASVVTLPSQRTYEYTATANQTTFTGSDDNGNTLSYDVEKLNVYVNGILLATEDYTATNTTSVVLTTGAAVDDIVQVVAWKAAVAGELDSDATIALIDSAYIQARQLGSEITIQDEGSSLSTAATTLNFVGSAVTASGTGTTKTITITQAEGGTDSATVSNIITTDVDSAYVQARQSTTDLTNYRTVTQIQSMIDSDIDAIVDAAPGALDTLNELAAALGDDANFSTTVTNSIAAKVDSAQAIVAVTSSDLDMSGNKVLFGNVYSQTSDLPSASTYHGMFAHVHATGKGYFAHGGNWIELANHSQLANSSNWDTAYGWGDHSTQGYLTDAIDSARVTSLIDSSYVQARQTAQDFAFSSLTGTPTTIAGYGITDAFDGAYSSLTGVPSTFAPSGVDSNATFAIIDSAYVQARQSTASDFDSASAISLIDSAYVQARQNEAGGTDSAAVVALIDSNYIQARQANASPGATTIVTTNYTADSGDTSFAASYTIGKLNVYLNGILLVDSDDYTASNGNSVVLTSAADSGDTVQIISYVSEVVGTLDSAGVTALVDSDYIQARQLGSEITIQDEGSSLSTAATTLNFVGSAVTASGTGTTKTITITQAEGGTDSATVSAIVATDVDSAYVQARQTTADLTNYRTVTQIESMIDSNVNAVIDAAPGALNTLNELAAALGDDANFSTTITNSIAEKVDSAQVVGIVDSAYVQARQTAQDFAFSSLTGTPTTISGYGITDAFDGAYSSLSGVPSTFAPTGVDSSATISLIDSAYIQARQTNGYSEGTVDAILVDGNSASDTTYDGVFWTAGSDTSGAGYNQGGGLTWNSTNGSVTVSSGGLYEIKFHAYFTASGGETGNQRFQLYKNGSNYIGGFVHKSLGSGETAVQSGSATVPLSAGDYIQIRGGSGSSWRPRVYGGSGHTYLQVIKQENGVLDTGIDSSTITSIVDSAYVSARAGSSGIDSASTLSLFSVTTGDPFAVTVGADSASFDLLNDVNHTEVPDLTTGLERNGLLFSDDGGVMYIADDDGIVRRYTLSTAYDPESYTETHSNYIDLGLTNQSLMHRTTGGYFLSTNYGGDIIRLFTSSDGFDTFSYVGNTTGQLDTTNDGLTSPISAQFNADGTVLWVYDGKNTNVGYYRKYTLSTGYDLSTATYQSSASTAVKLGASTVSGASSNGEWFQFAFNNNGKIVFEYDGDNLALFRLATAYDLSSTGTLLQSYNKSSFIGSISNSHTAWQWVHTSSKNAIFTMPRNYNNMVEIPLNYTGSEGTPANPASLVYSGDSGVYTYTPPKIVDSADVISLIDSAYIQARQSTASDFDSNSAISLIDSAYIQARQNTTTSLAFSAITSTPTTLAGYGITDGGGTDSASVIALIDSDYVQARQTTMSSGATTVSTTTFTATAGQTTFTTSYTVGKINVYLNGILLVDTSDYTASNGTSIVLGTAAVANDILQVVKYTTQAVGTLDSAGVTGLIDSAYVQARQDFAYGSLTGTPTIPTNNNQLTNGAGYITGYTVTESDVTGHEAALTITESQISDLGTYLTSSSLTNYRTVTQIQSMIDSDIDALVDAAPGSLNTLNELAAALGDDANFSTTVTNSIAAKLPLAGGTMTGAIAMGSNKITGLGTPTASADAATKAYADTMLPLSGGTMSGNIDLDNNELLNINYLRFKDPGVEEGIGWTGGNGWQIFEAPNAMTNGSGNLQFTTGNSTSDRMMTIDTNGNLELPTGRLTQVSDDPLRIRSSTNASPVSIEFSDLATSNNYDQYGTISYTHSDAASTSAGISGANEVFIIEGTETVTGIKLDGRLLVTGTSEFQGDVDFGSNQITYSNVYSQTSDLPSASTYHGMFAHVHATGKGYFAHSGNWVELANNSDVPTDVSDLTDTTSLLGTGGLDSAATTSLIDSAYISSIVPAATTVKFTHDRIYARLQMSSNQTGISSTTVALTTFNTRDVDTSPNNALTSTLADGKFIIPAGVSKIRLFASCKTSSVTDQVTMTFWKNGTFFDGTTNIDVSSTGRDHAAAFTGIIDVVEDDYFQIAMFSQNSRTAEADELSWFELEVIEGSMLDTEITSLIQLSDLTNVDSASPSDGQALVWDSDNNYWKPGTVASSGGLDSASTIALIDSAYIQARQTSGGSGTVDSADIIAIVDSDYIQARQSSTGGTTITSGGAFAARTYHYTASANQTNFTGADDNGDILAITDSDANVYLNGILLMRTTDYTVGSNSITLQSGADSDNIISIVSYTGNHLDSNYILSRVSGGATTTSFTATANQTVFSGGGFTYKPDNLTVFYNGILLLDSDDYTATDGTSITLTSGATAGHKLTAVAYTMGNAVNGVDVTTSTFTATAGQTVFNNLDDNGNRLSYNVGNAAIYLNGILLSPADYTANNSTRVVLTEAADSGNVLTVMSYAGSQQTVTADSSSWYEVSTTTYNAAPTDKLFVDVSSAAATVSLPTSPSMGDEVRVIDATGNAATNNITIGRNGSKINGADSDLTLDIDRAAVGLVYYNAAQGWILMER